MKAIDNLKEYIAEDKIYQDWCNGQFSYVSDFDRFCINHVKDIKEVIDKLEEQEKEIKVLKWDNNDKKGIENNYLDLLEENQLLKIQVSAREEVANKYKFVLDEIREYITSYSSIHTIQFGTEEDSLNDIEANKMLDEKTITEMTHRYLKVHDKLLQILDKATEQKW